MNQNKKGYESEDGIGVVMYDDNTSLQSKCNRTLCGLLITTSLVIACLIGYIGGYWAGEQEIIKQTQLLQQPQLPQFNDDANLDDMGQIGEIEQELDGFNKFLYNEPKGGIFPPPMGIFSAGNGAGGGGLTEAEKKRLEEARAKCDAKKCCREDDDIDTDSSSCPDLGYLECLAADNACVWDCTEGKHDPDDLHYDREFKGIDRHDAYGIDRPRCNGEQDDINKDKIDPDLIVDTVDECGTLYEFHLKKEDRLKEEERVRNNKKQHEEGGDGDGNNDDNNNRRRFIDSSVNFTESGEMNETLRRQLRVIGADGRTSVTSWQWPYYKVVYITYQTNTGRKRCSGSLITPRHVLTAGHCISDGSGNFYWDWKVYPNHNAGYSREFTVYQGWVFNGWHYNRDWNWDIAILTLHTSNTGFGWFGFGYNTGIASNWNFGVVGYPGDKGTWMQRQNMCMDYQISHNLLLTRTGDIVGGNSGGPAYLDSSKVVYGVVSHEVYYTFSGIGKYNGHARITKEKFDAMLHYISCFPETAYYRNYIK